MLGDQLRDQNDASAVQVCVVESFRLQFLRFDFSWGECNTQEKLETMVMQFFFFLGGPNKVLYGLCENGEQTLFTTPTIFGRALGERG